MIVRVVSVSALDLEAKLALQDDSELTVFLPEPTTFGSAVRLPLEGALGIDQAHDPNRCRLHTSGLEEHDRVLHGLLVAGGFGAADDDRRSPIVVLIVQDEITRERHDDA